MFLRTRYNRLLLAPAGDAPAGGNGTTPPDGGAAPVTPPAAPPAPDLEHPAVKAALEKARKEAEANALAKAKKEADEAKRLSELDAEQRAKAEAKKANDEKAAAIAERDAALRERDVTRALAALGLQAADEEVGALATSVAAKLVEGGKTWQEAFEQVSKDRPYMFTKTGPQSQQQAPAQAAAPATPAKQPPGSSPAQVQAARTANTGGTPTPPAATPTPTKINAYDLPQDQYEAQVARIMQGHMPGA